MNKGITAPEQCGSSSEGELVAHSELACPSSESAAPSSELGIPVPCTEQSTNETKTSSTEMAAESTQGLPVIVITVRLEFCLQLIHGFCCRFD